MAEMFYFGPLKESGHYLFHENGQEVLSFERPHLGIPWIDAEIDGILQPGAPDPGDRLQRRTRPMKEGEALIHYRNGWTALALWDSSVDTRPGCSSTFMIVGMYWFEEMLKLAQERYPARWAKMKFPVVNVTEKDPLCLCRHLGPDGEGDHTGPPWCEPMKRKTCVHPECQAKKFGPCKGFGTLKSATDFIMDESFGGP